MINLHFDCDQKYDLSMFYEDIINKCITGKNKHLGILFPVKRPDESTYAGIFIFAKKKLFDNCSVFLTKNSTNKKPHEKKGSAAARLACWPGNKHVS